MSIEVSVLLANEKKKMRTGCGVLPDLDGRLARLVRACRRSVGRAVVALAVVGAGASVTAAAANAATLYWANFGNGTIGQANLDGKNVSQNVSQSFITGASGPLGVAADRTHIYWANSGNGTIGEANLDGTDVNQSFIAGADHPTGVAVSG